MLNQEHINNLVDFYSAHKSCINQKNEIVASPSYLPHYRNKSEEQILYEYFKEKRGYPENHSESGLASSSRTEKDGSRVSNRDSATASYSREVNDEYSGGQNSFQSQKSTQYASNVETKRPGYSSQEPRDSHLEIRPSDPRLSAREEEEPRKEELNSKKSSNLLDRLNAKKRENKQDPNPSKAEKVKDEQDSSSEKFKGSIQDGSIRSNRDDEYNDVQESTNKRRGFMSLVKESQPNNARFQEQQAQPREEDVRPKKSAAEQNLDDDEYNGVQEPVGRKGFMSVVNGGSQAKNSRPQEQTIQPKEEEFLPKSDVSNMSFDISDASFREQSKYRDLDIDEPKSLVNQVSNSREGPPRSNIIDRSKEKAATQDINNRTLESPSNSSFLGQSHYKGLDIDEPKSLANQVSSLREGPPKSNIMDGIKGRAAAAAAVQEQPDGKLKKIFEQESQVSNRYGAQEEEPSYMPVPTTEDSNYRPKQEMPRVIRLSGPDRDTIDRDQTQEKQVSSGLYSPNEPINEGYGASIRFGSRSQKNEFVKHEEEENLLPRQVDPDYRGLGATSKQEGPGKRLTLEKEPEESHEDCEPMVRPDDSRGQSKRDSMRQSQASSASRQRGTEEPGSRDYDESEHHSAVLKREDSKNKSQIRPKQEYTEESEKDNSYRKREYSNEEDTRMSASQYGNQKEYESYNQRNTEYRGGQPSSALGKPARSETSIADSSDKRPSGKTGKGEVRSVISYVKSIEEMLVKLLAKQEVLEENQRKILQAQKRQEEAFEDIRLHMTGEE